MFHLISQMVILEESLPVAAGKKMKELLRQRKIWMKISMTRTRTRMRTCRARRGIVRRRVCQETQRRRVHRRRKSDSLRPRHRHRTAKRWAMVKVRLKVSRDKMVVQEVPVVAVVTVQVVNHDEHERPLRTNSW